MWRTGISNRWTRGASALALVSVAVLLAASAAAGASARSPSTAVVYRFGVVGNRGAIRQLQLDTPTRVPGISGHIVQIATSNSDGYALTSDGTVWAWGVASFGELGNGEDPSYSTRAVKVQFPAGVRIASLANPMPFDGALAIDSSGHVWGWGLNALGDLCLSGLTMLRPTELPLSGVSLATGAAHPLALLLGWHGLRLRRRPLRRTRHRLHHEQLHAGPCQRPAEHSGRCGTHLFVGGVRGAPQERHVLQLGLQRRRTARQRHDC